MAERFQTVSQYRDDFKQAIERIRGVVRMRVQAKDHAIYMSVLDQIWDFVQTGKGVEDVLDRLKVSKDATRRTLREKPVIMVEVLNEIGGIEEELAEFISVLERAKKRGDKT